jgi:acetylornithine deacetylase/succinyl-diaminopimelate desuccinylase-like protein
MAAKEILRQMVGINSVFPNEAKLGSFLESYLKREGFKVQRHYISSGRFNLLAERGTGKSSILFYGHMDTVPLYGNWKSDPLTLTQNGDRLYGVGSCDMKGGIAAMLDAVSQVDERKIKILLASDEENISKGAWMAVQQKKRWFFDVDLAISCEPGDSKHYTGGANVVTIGRRGRTVIAIDVKGLSSHGANAQRGINAIDEAAKIAESIRKFKLVYHRKLGWENVFVRNIHGESTSLSVPDKAHLELDIQLVPPSTVASSKKRVEDLIKSMYESGRLHDLTKVSVYVKKRETPYIEPYVNEVKSKTIRRLLKIVRETIGTPRLNYGSSVADDNILFNALDVHVVTIGPRGGNIHSQNEWISERSLNDLVKLYKAIISRI